MSVGNYLSSTRDFGTSKDKICSGLINPVIYFDAKLDKMKVKWNNMEEHQIICISSIKISFEI